MILVDTNVLVAMADGRDGLHPVAKADYAELQSERLLLITPVLAEACYILPWSHYRERSKSVIDEAGMQVYPLEDERRLWAEVFAWLDRYREHEPDWTDACLAVLCGRDKRLKVWTYDKEFATIWRRPDGTKIPLAVKGRG